MNLKSTKILNIISAVLLILPVSCAGLKKSAHNKQELPGIDISFTDGETADSVFVTISPIPRDTAINLAAYFDIIDNGRNEAYAVKDWKVHIFPDSVPSTYQIRIDNYQYPMLYLRNTDNLSLAISDLSRKKFILKGGIYAITIPYYDQFQKLTPKLFSLSRYKLTQNELDSLSGEMYALIDRIMAETNPEGATRIISQLESDFTPYAFERLPEGAENTLFYTLARAKRNQEIRRLNNEQILNSSLETSAPVPEVSLQSLDGRIFNISDLKGKWVVIDFWTTWCAPCRRGFEKMKDLYHNYTDRLEIVGIACGDQTETWNKVVNELELPWINLLAPAPETQDGTVAGFPVSAYPTKVIIDPQGRLTDYTIGEHDEFYDRLERMLK